MRTEVKAKANVSRNMPESPRANHAVSEKGIYILRNTRAKRTEKVTVPISWYFPRRYPGTLRFFINFQVLDNTKVRKLTQNPNGMLIFAFDAETFNETLFDEQESCGYRNRSNLSCR